MTSSPSNIPPPPSAPLSASTSQRFSRVLSASIGLTMTGIHVLIVIMALALMPVMESKAATESSPVKNGLIALTLRDPAGRLQIFTIHPDGTSKQQLTFEGDNGRPDWSPDGRRIAFGTHRGNKEFVPGSSHKTFVAVMDADGSKLKLLTEGDAPDWSPDRKQIAFSKGGQIWVMGADGKDERQIIGNPTFKAGPSWSADGKQMVFILIVNHNSPTDPQPQIGIMNSDGTNERILTKERRMNVRVNADDTRTVLEMAYDANAPAWSPVADKIVFWSGIENRYGQVWVMNSDGTESRQLTDDPNHRNSDDPSWSPDGKKIIFSTGRSGRNELWVMDADGKNQRKVHDIDAFPFPGRASWQRGR